MPDDYSDSAFERQEELSEMQKMLKLQLEVLKHSPELATQMAELQKNMFTQASRDTPHVCLLCRKKRHFLLMVQTMAILVALRSGQEHLGLGAMACALRTPATRLYNVYPAEAAQQLVAWYIDEQTPPADQTPLPQPLWYSKEQMEWDGHE